ncbi:MAG: hypothetical protein DHS20C08_03910 [Rhodomicrobium sp.]|nr:MAG: hypothetical protein DHS20C08_03910 [Rhodomicrobium sp.]
MTPARDIAATLGVEWQSDTPLIIPEVWDVASARLLENSNYPVLCTSASSYAWAHGYRPSERVGLEELLIIAGRIARDCKTPLIADLEGCFDRSNQFVKKGVVAALTIGCKGIVIGDGGRDGLQQMLGIIEVANRIKSARIAEMEQKKKLFLIARTDVFHLAGIMANPFEEAINRASAYLNAGADLIHVSGIQNPDVVAELCARINGPVAITVSLSGAPSLERYNDSGVAVIALGTGLMRAAFTNMKAIAEELLGNGSFNYLNDAMTDNDLSDLITAPDQGNAALHAMLHKSASS